MEQTFRYSRSAIRAAYGLAAGYFALCTVLIVMILTAGDWKAQGYASPEGAFWGTFLVFFFLGGGLLFSLWWAVALKSHRLTITRSVVSTSSMFGIRTIPWNEVNELKWSKHPNHSSAGLRSDSGKMALQLHHYQPEDRLKLITWLSDIIPAERQRDWPLFCHQHALPLVDGRKRMERAREACGMLPLPTCHRNRRQYDVAFVMFSLPLFLIAWLSGLWKILAIEIVIIMLWLLLRFSIPPGGVRSTITPAGYKMALTYSLLMGLGAATRYLSGLPNLLLSAALVLIMALGVAAVMQQTKAMQYDKQLVLADAVRRWNDHREKTPLKADLI